MEPLEHNDEIPSTSYYGNHLTSSCFIPPLNCYTEHYNANNFLPSHQGIDKSFELKKMFFLSINKFCLNKISSGLILKTYMKLQYLVTFQLPMRIHKLSWYAYTIHICIPA